MPVDKFRHLKTRRWFQNQAGTMSTIVRVNVALSPDQYRYLERTTGGSRKEHLTIADKLYHLCREALDHEMLAAGVICE